MPVSRCETQQNEHFPHLATETDKLFSYSDGSPTYSMSDVFTTLDIVIFITSLIGVMAVGLIAGRKVNTTQDYFLAGRQIRWWGVAGSIFGSNVFMMFCVSDAGSGT